MVWFACPQCHNALQVEDHAAGKKLKCPQCGGALAIPAGKQGPGVALCKATPLRKAAPLANATAGPARKDPFTNPLRALPDAAVGPMAAGVGGSRRSLLLPLGIGGVALVGAAVAVTLWATGHLSHSQTSAPGHREDGVQQVAGLPSSPTNAVIASPAAQATPAAAAPPGVVPIPAAPAATPPAPPGGVVASTPFAAAPQSPSAPAPATALASVPVAAGRAEIVDVLRQIDPVRDSARGAWAFQSRGLASPRNEMGVIRLPVTPPAEYRLTVTVERTTSFRPAKTIPVPSPPEQRPRYPSHALPPGLRNRMPPSQELSPPVTESDEGLDIVLSVGGHSAALVLDGWQRTTSGLEFIDGRGAEQNGTALHGEILPRYHTVTVICTVGPGSVDATVGGRSIVHWTGASDLLSIDTGLAAEIGNSMALVSSSQFCIHRIELVPLRGAASPIGPPAVTALPVAPRGSAPAGQVAAVAHPTTAAVVSAPAALAKLAVVPSPEALQCVALIEHPRGSGSGFAVGKKLVVTDAHVVEGVFPDEIKVQFGAENSKSQPIARILYFDRARDLCVIELQSERAGLSVRGDYTFNSGDGVTLVGNPAAGGDILMRNAVNHGRLSSVVRIDNQDFYQIDASVNPGWSGGPVLDAEGQVVAVVARKINDKAVTAIRAAMGKLDEGFRTRIGRTTYQVGLTYGIPASALGNILKDPALHDEQRQAEANDKFIASTLADRLSFLAELCMVRIQIHVPKQVRSEARNLAHGRTPSGARRGPGQREVLDLMSEVEASRLSKLLNDEGLKSMESKFRDRLDERINAIQGSAYLPDLVKHDLRTLAVKVREGSTFAEHPLTTYAAFSAKFKGLSRDFKDHLKRLAENLKEKES